MLLKKIEQWKRKAMNETDPFDRYLSIFIAYNIFYNLYKKTENPSADLIYGDSTRAIEVQSLIGSSKLLKLLEPNLKEYFELIPIYREEYWGRQKEVPIYETLVAAYYDENAEKTIEMLLKWLYKVRCNLVHGEKNYDDKLQKKLLTQSSLLLRTILSHAMESYHQLYVYGSKKGAFSP